MTAKPEPMAGQTDPAEDLIAELAKLMAQDARGDQPAAPARPTLAVRIPGGDTPVAPEASHAEPPVPRFEPRQPAAPAVEPVVRPVAPSVAGPTSAVPQRPATRSEPAFDFDFGLGNPEPSAPAPTPAPAPVAAQPPRPAPSEPRFAPAAPPPAMPEPEPEPAVDAGHDSIADLIAAELAHQADEPVAPPAAAPVQARVEPSLSFDAPQPRAAVEPPLDDFAAGQETVVGDDNAPEPEQQDRFRFPPVFGLGSRPAAPQEPVVAPTPVEPALAAPIPAQAMRPSAPPVATAPIAPVAAEDNLGTDPIDEIESLIGRAVRVDMDKPAEPAVPERPAPSPALRSLATPTLPAEPVSAPVRPAKRRLTGADEAIFAAAEASGAQVGWVDGHGEDDIVEEVQGRRPRSFRMSRAVAGPLVALTLLLAAGLGLYWVLGMGGESGPAPVLVADTSPTKETPAAPESTAQQSVVFNEIDGVVPGAEEQLVSRDQTDVNEVTQTPPAAEVSEEGLANRKVRTVTVRPDGTIVSGDDSVAGSSILPVDRPNVPAVPGASTSVPDLIAAAATDATTQPTPAATTPTPAATTPAVVPVTPGSTVPAVDAAGNAIPGKTTVVPRTKPTNLAQSSAPLGATSVPTSPVNAVIETPAPTLSNTPAAAATPSPAVSQPVEVDALPNNAPAYVQLASQRTEEEARATAQSMVSRFGPLFGGANMEVQRVDLGARGIYYRVRVPASSLQDANSICNNVKAAGGDCFTM